MKNVIKRPYFGWASNVETTADNLTLTLFPSWYEEVSQPNKFLYRFNTSVNTLVEDVKREQRIVVSQFSFDTLDVTKPYYITSIDEFTSLNTQYRFTLSANSESLYDDIFRTAIRIKDLGEQYEDSFLTIRQNLLAGKYNYVTEDSVSSAEGRVFICKNIKQALLPGEQLLGGEELCATSLGRIFNTTTGQLVSGLEKVEEEQSRDSGYFLLPLLTDTESITFFDIDDNQVDIDARAFIVGFSNVISDYVPDFDIDRDGYISEDDLNFIRNSVGKNTLNTPESEWRDIYYKLDKNQDGVITESDIYQAELTLHGVKESCIILRKPIAGYCVARFLAYPAPYITYATRSLQVRGGTFGYNDPSLEAIDPRISDGYIENSSGYVLGFNRARGEIWTGRLIEDRYELAKVSYKYNSRMVPIGFTSVDQVAFILLKSTVSGFRVFGSEYAILRIDAYKEKVEISNDLISLEIQLPDGVTYTGIQSTDRKDTFRIFTSEGDIHTFRLLRNAVLNEVDGLWVSEGTEAYVPKESIVSYQRIYNDIDGFGFNFGMNRLPFETNEKFKERIFRKVSDPPNNSIQGMHDNYSLDLGLYFTWLYRDIDITLLNNVDLNSEIRIFIDDIDFERYPNKLITLHLSDPQQVINKTTKPVFINGEASSVVNEVRVESYFVLNSGDYLQDRNLILRKETQKRILEVLLLGNTEKLLDVPNYDEELVWFKNITLRLEYTAIDPDGVLHPDAYQTFTTNISSIDLIDTSVVYTPGSISMISPSSKTAKYIPRTYAMVREGSKNYIGDNRWNQRIQEIFQNDTSYWGKTIFNIVPFDDRFNSTYFVDSSKFDNGLFDNDIVEVAL